MRTSAFSMSSAVSSSEGRSSPITSDVGSIWLPLPASTRSTGHDRHWQGNAGSRTSTSRCGSVSGSSASERTHRPPLVQRQVIINSFAFTLLVAPLDRELPCDELEQATKSFAGAYPEAIPIVSTPNLATVSASKDLAALSFFPLLYHYPSRFGDEPNPYVVHALKGEMKLVMLYITRELIVGGDTEPIADALRDMVSTREKATAFRQRVGVMVDGFNTDNRDLWQIPEANRFIRRLFVECPFVMLLAHPNASLLKLIMACWMFEDPPFEVDADRRQLKDFLDRAFHGLNEVSHDLALSEELNRDICEQASKTLFGESPPSKS